MSDTAIKSENRSKQYRLGVVGARIKNITKSGVYVGSPARKIK